jgi:hypothetical protein
MWTTYLGKTKVDDFYRGFACGAIALYDGCDVAKLTTKGQRAITVDGDFPRNLGIPILPTDGALGNVSHISRP